MPLRIKRRLAFPLLTIVLIVAAVELGSLLLLSVNAGRLVTYSDLQALRWQSRGPETFEVARQEKNWAEHRMVEAPALHPYVGYVQDPSGHPAASRPEFSTEARDYGFPENLRDLFRPADDDEFVLGIFGGSFAAHLALRRPLLNQVFRRELPWLAGKRLTVLSFAAGGYKQPQQLTALNYVLALGADFDLVINVDGFNEIALPAVTNVPKGYFPFYPRGWLLMVDDLDQDLRQAIGELSFLRRRRAEVAGFFERAPWRYSLTAGALWQALDSRWDQRIAAFEARALAQERSPSALYQARGPHREYSSEEAMFEDLAAVWQRSSLQMHRLCQGLGIGYFHFLQPNQYLPGSKPLTDTELHTAWLETHPYKDAVPKGYPLLIAAGEELRAAGVPFTDLSRLYAGVEETLYRDTCCHVNRRGNELVAEAVAEVLKGWKPG